MLTIADSHSLDSSAVTNTFVTKFRSVAQVNTHRQETMLHQFANCLFRRGAWNRNDPVTYDSVMHSKCVSTTSAASTRRPTQLEPGCSTNPRRLKTCSHRIRHRNAMQCKIMHGTMQQHRAAIWCHRRRHALQRPGVDACCKPIGSDISMLMLKLRLLGLS